MRTGEWVASKISLPRAFNYSYRGPLSRRPTCRRFRRTQYASGDLSVTGEAAEAESKRIRNHYRAPSRSKRDDVACRSTREPSFVHSVDYRVSARSAWVEGGKKKLSSFLVGLD